MPKLIHRRNDRRKQESTYLLNHARNVTSQAGEDGILERMLQLLGPVQGSRWCVEFGAWDGKHMSNTWNLIHSAGYHGVLIEGSSARFADLLRTYGNQPRAVCVNRVVSFERGPDCLDAILAGTPLPKVFDLISIDIDGNDYYVWESLQDYRPRIVLIEFNSTVPNDVVFVQDNDIAVNQGCSLLALVELGKAKGYELACVTALNAIFVRTDDFGKLGIADNSIDAMFCPLYEPKLFYGFDGTVYNIFNRPQWVLKNVKVSPTQFQLLAPEVRRRYAGGISLITEAERGGGTKPAAPAPTSVAPAAPAPPVMSTADVERVYGHRGRYDRLVETLLRMRADARKPRTPPPKQMPRELADAYLMGGRAQLMEWYFDSSVDPKAIGSVVPYQRKDIDAVIEDVRAGRYKSYGRINDYLRQALEAYPVRGKRVLIAGSVYPQYECFALLHGAHPVTVEYNPRISDDERLAFFTPDQFARLKVRMEAAISISSYEHDGLGRYGDPLGPDSDLRTLAQLKEQMQPGALLYLSVPVGIDTVVWNAHRIYGPARLPMLLRDWELLRVFCDGEQPCSVRDGRIAIDEGRWGAAFKLTRSAPEWVFVLRNA